MVWLEIRKLNGEFLRNFSVKSNKLSLNIFGRSLLAIIVVAVAEANRHKKDTVCRLARIQQ